MTSEELSNIIARFDKEQLQKNALYGMYMYGGGADESYISANSEGLLLFALQLLQVAHERHADTPKGKTATINLATHEQWMDENSDIYLRYVEFVDSFPQPASDTKDSSSVGSIFVTTGYALLALCFVGIFILGIVSLIRWMC